MLRLSRLNRHVVNIHRRSIRTRQRKEIQLPKSSQWKTASATSSHLDHSNEESKAPDRSSGGFSSLVGSQRYVLYILLGLSLGAGLYVSQLVAAMIKATNEPPPVPNIAEQKDVAQRYEEIANSFDNDVNFSEYIMGILSLRKSLAKSCRGNVLEVSCGTGRNLGYFDLSTKNDNVKSLTFIDLSPQMVNVCQRKWSTLHGPKSLKTGIYANRPIRFVAGSALDSMPLAPDGQKYDTIFQTMGLCSTASPKELLINIARHLNDKNPDARIILLEHGRAHGDWLNRILDNGAEKHAELYGCWSNRDIDAIVIDAAKDTGLDVVKTSRHHLGTTFVYELRLDPKQRAKFEQNAATEIAEPGQLAQKAWKSWFSKSET